MALIDTLDSVMMASAYRWASVEPLRKVYYNLAITLASVAVAVGGFELLGLAGDGMSSGLSRIVAGLNDNFAVIGLLIIALFGGSWLTFFAIWRARSA